MDERVLCGGYFDREGGGALSNSGQDECNGHASENSRRSENLILGICHGGKERRSIE